MTPTVRRGRATRRWLWALFLGAGTVAAVSGQDAPSVSTATEIEQVVPAGGRHYARTRRAGVFASLDGGRTWEARNAGLPHRVVHPFPQPPEYRFITALGVDPRNPLRVAATTAHGLYLSEDGGGSWQALPTAAPIRPNAYFTSVAPSPHHPDGLLLGTSFNGVYETTDRGGSWHHLSSAIRFLTHDALFYEEVAALSYDPALPDAIAVLAGFDGGVFVNPDRHAQRDRADGDWWRHYPLPVPAATHLTYVPAAYGWILEAGTRDSRWWLAGDGTWTPAGVREPVSAPPRAAAAAAAGTPQDRSSVQSASGVPDVPPAAAPAAGPQQGEQRAARAATARERPNPQLAPGIPAAPPPESERPVATPEPEQPVATPAPEPERPVATAAPDPEQPVTTSPADPERPVATPAPESAPSITTPTRAVTPENVPTRRRLAHAAQRHGIYLSAWSAAARLPEFLEFLQQHGLNSFVVDLKDDSGFLTYDSELALAHELGAVQGPIRLDELVAEAHAAGIYVIGRMVVFKDRFLYRWQDHRLAVWDRERDAPWRHLIPVTPVRATTTEDSDAAAHADGTATETAEETAPDPEPATEQREFWVDPYAVEVWEYNVAVAAEIAGRGVDEIQFDYIRFPSDGPVERAGYRNRRPGMTRIDAIESFLAMAREQVRAPISTDLFGFNSWYRSGNWIGQNIEILSEYVDVISPMFYPSHFPNDFLSDRSYLERAHDIYEQGVRRARHLVQGRSYIRPYVQAFLIGGELRMEEEEYGRYLTLQLEGNRTAGGTGFTLWNASNRYYMVTEPLRPYLSQHGHSVTGGS